LQNDGEKDIDHLETKTKVIEALQQLVKEWKTLRVILQTKKVIENQCCNNLLEYLFTPTVKPIYNYFYFYLLP